MLCSYHIIRLLLWVRQSTKSSRCGVCLQVIISGSACSADGETRCTRTRNSHNNIDRPSQHEQQKPRIKQHGQRHAVCIWIPRQSPPPSLKVPSGGRHSPKKSCFAAASECPPTENHACLTNRSSKHPIEEGCSSLGVARLLAGLPPSSGAFEKKHTCGLVCSKRSHHAEQYSVACHKPWPPCVLGATEYGADRDKYR